MDGHAEIPAPAVRDGLAYVRVDPAGAPRGGVVILHGAGSCKENHLDFACACRAATMDPSSTTEAQQEACARFLSGRADRP